MNYLILLRHGQSEWNKKNIFTGWVDVPLSIEGIEEAFQAGRALSSFPIDVIFSSTLIRGIMTALLVMNVHEGKKIPVIMHKDKRHACYSQEVKDGVVPLYTSEALNERMYGELQGMNKDEMRKKFGPEKVHMWRRSYDVAPPSGESLKMTSERTWPYFEKEVISSLNSGKNVLISAHGNSLRSIVMHLDKLNEEQVLQLEIPTGHPLIYTFNQGTFLKNV